MIQLFGIEAVKANTPGAQESYIAASVDYYVETKIGFEFSASFDFNFESFALEMADKHGQDLGDVTAANNFNDFNTVNRYGLPLFN